MQLKKTLAKIIFFMYKINPIVSKKTSIVDV